MPIDAVIDGYLRSVDEELDATARLNAPPPNRLASYHLQQAAEKLAKAICLHRGHISTKEHRIFSIVEKLEEDDPWKEKLEPLDDLSQYATTYRYATSIGRLKEGLDAEDVSLLSGKIRQLLTEARTECNVPFRGKAR